MKIIKKLVDEIAEEIEGAKDYAETAAEHKMNGEMAKAVKYKEMAHDELRHAEILHSFVKEEIEKASKVFTPPVSMMEEWQNSHRRYIEHAAWIKQMLEM